MKTWNGMITNLNDIETIKANGARITWTETGTRGDIKTMNGYEYNGKRYTIGIDRDGWPIAWEKA